MRAILEIIGEEITIYSLDLEGENGRNEVRDFLDRINEQEVKSAIKGFRQKIMHIADNGTTGLSEKVWKQWKHRSFPLAEIRQGDWRISCFRFPENRLLLATAFKKQRDQEVGEYDRAVGRCRDFTVQQEWGDEDESH